MIVTALRGGLGNQLFQYATARSLAFRRSARLVLDLSWYTNTPATNTPRRYELHNYAIVGQPADREEARLCRLHHGRVLSRLPLLPRRWRHYREGGFDFDPLVLNLAADTYLDGYWQSYRYFDEIGDRIREEFKILGDLSPLAQTIAQSIVLQGQCSVSIHFRRGDYVSNPSAAAMHGLCGLDYYHRAMQYLHHRVEKSHFFVFSDDIDWVRRNVEFAAPVTFVDYLSPRSDVEQLWLMSLCRHHVIANSSFSWWGAYLGHQAGNVVIAPHRWFADGRPTISLIPDQWIRV